MNYTNYLDLYWGTFWIVLGAGSAFILVLGVMGLGAVCLDYLDARAMKRKP